MPPLPGKILIGWLSRDDAVRILTTACHHDAPLSDAEAETLWCPYHDRVEQLNERPREIPTRYPLRVAERQFARTFLRRARRINPDIDGVIKVDLRELSVRQLDVVVDRAIDHGTRVCSVHGWRTQCLQVKPPARIIPARKVAANKVIFDLPHAEFRAIVVQQPNGTYEVGVEEHPKWVTVTPYDGRMMLWAGYHRSYARVNSADAAEDAVGDFAQPVVLIPNLVTPANAASVSMATGLRPPIFRDFFDERFFMNVQLREKRYEIHATFNGTAAPSIQLAQPFV